MAMKVKNLIAVSAVICLMSVVGSTPMRANAIPVGTEVIEAPVEESTIEKNTTEEVVEKARTGIVEIMSGFYDAQGKFRKMQSGSGFLIRNEDNETYIVTSQTIVTNSNSAKKKYCEKKEIAIEGNIPSTVIKVIVKGDVSVEAEIVAESKEKDFCILNIENVISEKNALRLEDNTKLRANDAIYAMGFPKEEDLEYIPEEVECNLGVIEDSELNWQDVLHIQHTAYVEEGSIGGPLLNDAGYVVGINCRKILEDETEIYCALPIGEVIEVLDNFSIDYESSMRDKWSAELKQLYEKCKNLSESKEYKEESLTELQTALITVEKLKEQEKVTIEELEQVCTTLKEATDALIPKMEKIQIVIYVLASLIIVLAIWLILLIILRCLDKRRGTVRTQPTVHSQNTQGTVGVKNLILLQRRTGKTLTITDMRVVVGKNPNTADFCVTDNKMVSREHAAFQQQNGKFYVCDLRSSNGTFVNGSKIPVESFIEIKAGDEVVLANEKFVVR